MKFRKKLGNKIKKRNKAELATLLQRTPKVLLHILSDFEHKEGAF